ncbi:hypothetical protein AYY26_02965 [Photobacterium phosphoreum]|uniref:glycosyltransferase n=1 Tax=Photobacterium phosphoreum TaxID=659 RepID=UPI0007F97172|nr:glycosyltransferase [Photobacterium phosphoreum]OBU45376.1 hypothetical protein AYY26_02965 [Photobacterium phosphoreum]
MKRVCCAVTTYNPSLDDIKNIYSKKDLFDLIIIYDNSECEIRELSKLEDEPKIKLFSNKNNDGLSLAFNFMFSYAIDNNFKFVYLLDQDSRILIDELEELKKIIISDNDVNIAIYGPYIEYKHIKKNSYTR